jgi:transaldolase
VKLISPFVGRILDWYKKHTGRESYPPAEDPGVQSVTQIYNYFRKYDFPTEVMGASFRNIGEIIELAGCDLLTISPALLAELQNTEGHLERKLDPEKAKQMDIPRLVMDRATFDQMHRENRMASEKLEEGIQGFSKALEVLEKLLTERLQKLEGAKETITHAAQDVFRLYDLDGDGFITREEWMGADRVFDALDTNQDGKITPEEMLVGLGAAVYLKN